MVSITFYLFVLVASYLCMAFVSAMERGFMLLTREAIEKLREGERKQRLLLLNLLKRPQELRQAIIIYRMLFLCIFIFVFVWKVVPYFNLDKHLVWTLIGVAFVIAAANILPQRMAAPYALKFISKISTLTHILLRIVSPFITRKSIRSDKTDENDTIENIEHVIETRGGEKTNVEKDMLKSILHFGTTTVDEVMTPRVDVVSVSVNAGYKDVLSCIVSENFSRIPVYEDTSDRIKGILYVKDLLPYLKENDDFNWKRLIRQPYFVPESKMVDDLLREFQKEKVHIAIVVDEYGSMSGIVTMEDLLEEIVGEINDEFDEEERNIIKINDTEFIVEGKTALADFYEALDLDERDYETIARDSETVAGMVLTLFNAFPKPHQRCEYGGLSFEVFAVDSHRISKIQVRKLTIEDSESHKT